MHPVEFGHNKHRLERQKEADQEEEEWWKKVAPPDYVTLSPKISSLAVLDLVYNGIDSIQRHRL